MEHRLRIELGEGPTLPTEFRIFPLGKFSSLKGEFIFDAQAAKTVLAAYADHATELSIDYEHASVQKPGDIPAGAPAAGWFDLELRADGLYAVNVRWTPRAAKYLTDKEYRYFSPAFTTDEEGRVKRLVNVALTNLPATDGLKPLVAAKEDTPMNPEMLKQLTEALGGMTNACTSLGEGMKAHSTTLTEHGNLMKAHMEKMGGVSTVAPPPAKVETPVAQTKETLEAVTLLSAQVVDLKKQLDTRAQNEKDAEIVRIVDGMITECRAFPAQRDAYLVIGRENLTALKGIDKASPKIPGLAAPSVQVENNLVALNEWDEKYAKQLGVTDMNAYREHKRKMVLEGKLG